MGERHGAGVAAQQAVAHIDPLAQVPVGMVVADPGLVALDFLDPVIRGGDGFGALELGIERRVVEHRLRRRIGRVGERGRCEQPNANTVPNMPACPPTQLY